MTGQQSWARQNIFGLAVWAVIIVAAIAGITSYHRPVPPTATTPPPAWAVLTRAGIHDDLAAVLADQRQADKDHREAWVADGYSSDFNTLVDLAGGDEGTDKLAVDAMALNQDGWAYMQDYQDPGLSGNWRARYAQIRADLNALAADAGLAPVPAPQYQISGKPAPIGKPWSVTFGGTGACTATTTTTNSSSSTGASSKSTAVKTKCGTASTTNTRKTAVSAKGAITRTNTTTASG